MKFRTLLNPGECVPSPAGCRYKKCYIRSVDSFGVSSLADNGKEDLQLVINEASKGVLIDDLMRRFIRGDETAIRPVVDSYGDFTQLPKSLMDAQNSLASAKQRFDSLPASVKQKYGNNVSTWLSDVSSDEGLQKFNKVVSDLNARPKSDAKTKLFDAINEFVSGGKSE